jgi:hypothetical protein
MARRTITDFEDYRRQMRQRARAGESRMVLLKDASSPPRFPDLCPSCGGKANAPVLVQKVFHFASDDGEDAPTVQYLRPLFCAGCASRHHQEQRPVPSWTPLLRLVKGGGTGIAGLIVFGIGLYFVSEAISSFSLLLAGFALLPLAVGWILFMVNWRDTRHLAVSEATSVSKSVDFTPSLEESYEPSWRAFFFQREDYAARFRELNGDRLWDPGGQEARKAAKRRARTGDLKIAAVVAGVILILIWLYYKEFHGGGLDPD